MQSNNTGDARKCSKNGANDNSISLVYQNRPIYVEMRVIAGNFVNYVHNTQPETQFVPNCG